jgi:hypothetical protein
LDLPNWLKGYFAGTMAAFAYGVLIFGLNFLQRSLSPIKLLFIGGVPVLLFNAAWSILGAISIFVSAQCKTDDPILYRTQFAMVFIQMSTFAFGCIAMFLIWRVLAGIRDGWVG